MMSMVNKSLATKGSQTPLFALLKRLECYYFVQITKLFPQKTKQLKKGTYFSAGYYNCKCDKRVNFLIYLQKR